MQTVHLNFILKILLVIKQCYEYFYLKENSSFRFKWKNIISIIFVFLYFDNIWFHLRILFLMCLFQNAFECKDEKASYKSLEN